jgi:hypothetical protein
VIAERGAQHREQHRDARDLLPQGELLCREVRDDDQQRRQEGPHDERRAHQKAERQEQRVAWREDHRQSGWTEQAEPAPERRGRLRHREGELSAGERSGLEPIARRVDDARTAAQEVDDVGPREQEGTERAERDEASGRALREGAAHERRSHESEREQPATQHERDEPRRFVARSEREQRVVRHGPCTAHTW